MISFSLEEDQKMLVDTVRKFAGTLRDKARDLEKARGVTPELRRAFHELGLSLVDVPEDAGGLGLGILAAALVHEELGFGDAAAALALWAPGGATAAILELGSDEQRKRLCAKFAEPLVGAVAWSEKAAQGKDLPAQGFTTTARKDGDAWVLDGAKAFVVNGAVADLTVVFAQEHGTTGWDGVAGFVIEGKPQGFSAGARHDIEMIEATGLAELTLAGVRVPERNRLAPASRHVALRRFFARVALANAARQIGLARAAYEHALAYDQDRVAFGKPVAHFQAIAFTLADMHMDVESSRWMLWRAARAFDLGRDDALGLVAEAAFHCNDAAWRVADNGVQLLGGAGYIQDYPVEKWMRDTKALALYGTSDELSREHIAEHALGRPDFDSPLPAPALQPVLT